MNETEGLPDEQAPGDVCPEWAASLREKYGISQPFAPETEDSVPRAILEKAEEEIKERA